MALAQILLRGGTSAEWAAANPVLAARELAVDTTTKRVKVGDGQNAWSALPWVTMDAAEVARLEAAATALDAAADPYDAATATVLALPNGAARQELQRTIDAVVEAADFARLARMLEGVPFTVYGDSQAKNPSQGADAGTQFSDRLNGRQRFGSYTNRGVAGTTIAQIASQVESTWIANSRGLALVCSGIGNTSSDWGADGSTSAALAFRSILAVLTARAKFASSTPTFAFDSNWVNGAASAANSVFDFGVNGDEAYLLVQTATGAGGTIQVRDANNALRATINTGGRKAAFPAAFKISGLGAGDHILRGTLISGTASVVGLVVPSPTPVQVVWATVEPGRSNVAQRQSYVDAMAAVLTEFPGVLHITPGTGWVPTQHISGEDGLHLNDLGNAFMADRIETVLATSLDFHQGLNRLTRQTAAAAYVSPLPTPIVPPVTYLAYDNFERADGALGSTPTGNFAWAVSGGAASISGNAGRIDTVTSSSIGAIATVDVARSTGLTRAAFSGGNRGIYFGGNGSDQGYYFMYSNSGGGWRLGRRAGSFTALQTVTEAIATSPFVLSAEIVGDVIKCYVNGVLKIEFTDTTYRGSRMGVISIAGATAFDDFGFVAP